MSTNGVSVGNLYDVIRKVLSKLGKIEGETSDNTKAIEEIRNKALLAQAEIENLKKVAQHEALARHELE